MEELLRQWDLSKLIEVFQDNEITIEILPKLTDSYIKELIPNIGMRVRFMENFKKYFGNAEPSFYQNNTLDNIDISFSDILSESNSTASVSTNISSEVLIPIENREISLHSREQLDSYRIVFPEFDLRTLLITSPLGNSVLTFYDANKILDNTRRNRMVDIIMKHMFKYHVTHRLKHEDYNIITAKIITLFLTEATQTYYIPSVKKKDSFNRNSIAARGKLVDKARNLVHRSGVSTRKRKIGSSSEVPAKITTFTEEDVESQRFLRTRSEPWEEIVQHWNKTFHLRRSESERSLSLFLTKWPILEDPRADTLIDCDFDRLFPNRGLHFFGNWHNFFDGVIVARKGSNRYDEIEEILEEDVNENCKLAVHLLNIAKLVPPKGRKSIGKGKFWKFTVQECTDSIICHAKNPSDIPEIVEVQKKSALAKSVMVQPYLIVEGHDVRDIKNIYIVIDSVRYHFASLTKAFDVCFKAFHVFNAEYPPQSEHIWQLIAHIIYKLPLEKTTSYIMDIVAHFQSENR
ncbi:unnamed protein product [Phaedon cochleariae]|uniref:SAM domain-containing protein n=1 Tax=Phaedon cochleariae TaxID=80249 RepID=A0A9P0GXB6_PHACE|nr:unnamed protein product [Phaedon cochleariae]